MDIEAHQHEQRNNTEKLGEGGPIEGRGSGARPQLQGANPALGVVPNPLVPQFLYL